MPAIYEVVVPPSVLIDGRTGSTAVQVGDRVHPTEEVNITNQLPKWLVLRTGRVITINPARLRPLNFIKGEED